MFYYLIITGNHSSEDRPKLVLGAENLIRLYSKFNVLSIKIYYTNKKVKERAKQYLNSQFIFMYELE